jgi:serine/threonine protein kinase
MIGDLLQQRYQIVNFLGKGGQGHTYLAIDKHRPGNPKCVVKHLKPFFNDPQFLETAKRLFQSEAEIMGKLANYTHIPQLFAYFEQNKEFFLVQEFIDGDDLSKEISNGKILDENYVVNLLKGILPILEVLHQKGIIHRDIKPPNIIRRRSDRQLVLIDFGAVKQFQHDLTCGANISIDIGSPGYTPSEQLRGRPKPSSDIYALGMMCIQALTGVHPRKLEEDESEEVRWEHLIFINPTLAEIIKKMVRHNTKERYKSATEVLIALERLNDRASAPQTNSVERADVNRTERLAQKEFDRLNLNRDSESTRVAPSQNSASSSAIPQPFDPWTGSSLSTSASQPQTNSPVRPRNNLNAETEVFSSNTNSRLNPPIPSQKPIPANTEIVSPPVTPRNNLNAETEVFSSNTNSRLNPPIPSQNSTSAKTEIVPPDDRIRNNPPVTPRNNLNAETEVFSSNTNSRLNPPIPSQNSIPANKEIASSPSQTRNNPPVTPRNNLNAETEVFSSNTNSRLNLPIQSQNSTSAKTEIVSSPSQQQTNPPAESRNNLNADTEVLSFNSNSRLNPPISPQNSTSAKTEIVSPSDRTRNNPPVSPPTRLESKTKIDPPASSRNTNPPRSSQNRSLENQNRTVSGSGRQNISPPVRNYPSSYNSSNRSKKSNKIIPIAIGTTLAALATVGFFGFIQPTFLTEETKTTSVASKPKNTAKTQKSASNNSKTDKAKTNTSTKSTQSKKSDSNTEKYYNSDPLKDLGRDLPIDPETSEAKQLLAKANKLANSGKLQEAILEADKVSPQTGDEYLNAQTKIDKWSNSLIQKAIQKYQQQGKLSEAIAMLKTIPNSVSQSQTATDLSAKWNQEWTDNQVYVQDAQRAIIDRRWQDAVYAADGLSETNPYWKSKKSKLKQEITTKKIASEKKEQQLATQQQQSQPQPEVATQPQEAQPQMSVQPQQSQPQPEAATQTQQPQKIARKDANTSSTPNTSNVETSNGCIQGYVWREATPDDRICVTPQVRQQVAFDNSQVEDRRSAAAYDPETCVDGYVWREATPDDRTCVTPQVRMQTLQDNAQARSRMQ